MARVGPRTTVGLLLSLGLTAWFVHSIEWAELADAIKSVHLPLVLAASAALLMEFFLRAVRWKVLLRSLAPQAKVRDLFTATVIGAAANTLLPARAGEIAKPLVASRKTGVPFSAVIATAIVERMYDILGLVCVLVGMSFTLPDTIATNEADLILVQKLKLYGGLSGLVALCGLATFFTLAHRGSDARSLVDKLSKMAPERIASVIVNVFDDFVEGLKSVRDPRALWQAPLLSVVIWFNGVGAIAMLFAAFELQLPLGAACFTTVAIAVAVVLPQAPGFFGVFHVAIEKTLVLWHIAVNPAKAFAIVFWAVSFVPVTAVGLAALWREGLTLRGLWRN